MTQLLTIIFKDVLGNDQRVTEQRKILTSLERVLQL